MQNIKMDFNTRGRNQQFTYHEVKQFVEKPRNQNTVKKTNLDVKKLLGVRFLQDEPYSEKRSFRVSKKVGGDPKNQETYLTPIAAFWSFSSCFSQNLLFLTKLKSSKVLVRFLPYVHELRDDVFRKYVLNITVIFNIGSDVKIPYILNLDTLKFHPFYLSLSSSF